MNIKHSIHVEMINWNRRTTFYNSSKSNWYRKIGPILQFFQNLTFYIGSKSNWCSKTTFYINYVVKKNCNLLGFCQSVTFKSNKYDCYIKTNFYTDYMLNQYKKVGNLLKFCCHTTFYTNSRSHHIETFQIYNALRHDFLYLINFNRYKKPL